MKHVFRKTHPIRSNKTINNYKNHKTDLAKDFQNRCGYCNGHDQWLGREYVFQIDHFIPKSKYPDYEHRYSNLVYSCPYCNRAKSDDWPSNNPAEKTVGNKGYIDPCEADYCQTFYRDSEGRIYYENDIGEYMYKRLKFYLTRHSTLWCLDTLHDLKKELHQIRRQKVENHKIDSLIADLDDLFQQYFEKLEQHCKRNVAI